MKASRAVARPWSHRAARVRWKRQQWSAWLVALLALGGCKVGPDDIEYWEGTVKGPGKIVAVMLADKYPNELRTQAALALVHMNRPDRDGTADLQQALQRLEDEERNEVLAGMVPGLEAMMREREANGAPSARAIRAKDAAFLLVTHAPPEVKAKLTDDVIAWYMEDFNQRSLAGNFSAEQVIRALGAPAGKELVKGLKARMPAPALVKMSQLLGQVGDPQTKQEAAGKLVKIEHEMEGREFLDWVRQYVREQADKQAEGGGRKIDPKVLEQVAEDNRESRIVDGAIPALKWLADEPQVKKRLLELAVHPAANETGNTRRVRALQALEGKVGAEDLDQILKIATDKDNPASVRDYAFDRIGDIRSPSALNALWPMLGEEARLRWRAGELILAIGGPSVVSELFSRLPSGGDYPPEELEGYATRLGQMSPAPTEAVRAQLASPNWYARIVAIRYFERKGSPDDVQRIAALSGDKASVKGPRWGKIKTVGDAATEAAGAATQRLGQPGAK